MRDLGAVNRVGDIGVEQAPLDGVLAGLAKNHVEILDTMGGFPIGQQLCLELLDIGSPELGQSNVADSRVDVEADVGERLLAPYLPPRRRTAGLSDSVVRKLFGPKL